MKEKQNYENLIVLDCTLRDGGYYNEWHFSDKLVNSYLAAVSKTLVTHVEIGFRFKSRSGFKGPAAYSTDDYLSRLVIPSNISIGVMINASDLSGDRLKEDIAGMFPLSRRSSRLDFVRIASHYHELETAFEATVLLKDLGFIVGLNLMQISERSAQDIESFIRRSKNFPIDVLYCADSVGGLEQHDVEDIYKLFSKECTHVPFGFHAHDNLHLALLNSICAIKQGATWVDCTVSGMGRGPGNTKTEELLIELGTGTGRHNDLTLLLEVLNSEFYKLKRQYQWGTNIFYYLSGKWSIHPTYIQTMLNDSRYDALAIMSVLRFLKDKPERSKFILSLLNNKVNSSSSSNYRNWNPEETFRNRDVIILGNGQSVLEYSSEIIDFINKYQPIVIALNYNPYFNIKEIDLRVSSHPLRVHATLDQFLSDDKLVVIPFNVLDEKELELVSQNERIKNFEFTINENGFNLEDCCEIPSSLTLAYALGLVTKGKCKCIYVVGIDGYDLGDKRNDEIERIFNLLAKACPEKQVISLTGTNISSIEIKSIYGY